MSGRFSELGTNINYVIQELLKDQDLMKLLFYNNETPLSSPDIVNPSALLFNNIFPYPKLPLVEENQKAIITVMFSNARLNSNIKFKDYKLIFNIMCHVDLWKIRGGLRPYEIAQRIDNIFNEKRGTSLSIGKVIFDDFIYREYNQKFNGFYLCYSLTDFN